MFGNQIWCAVYVSNNTNSDSQNLTKTVDKTDSESAQTSTEEENEEKDCEEQSSNEEQSSTEEQSSEEVRGMKRENMKVKEVRVMK